MLKIYFIGNKIACIYLVDPPAKVNIIPPVGEESFNLTKGFNHHVLEASAESYRAITCNSVRIIWVASTKGNISSCQAKGIENLSTRLH